MCESCVPVAPSRLCNAKIPHPTALDSIQTAHLDCIYCIYCVWAPSIYDLVPRYKSLRVRILTIYYPIRCHQRQRTAVLAFYVFPGTQQSSTFNLQLRRPRSQRTLSNPHQKPHGKPATQTSILRAVPLHPQYSPCLPPFPPPSLRPSNLGPSSTLTDTHRSCSASTRLESTRLNPNLQFRFQPPHTELSIPSPPMPLPFPHLAQTTFNPQPPSDSSIPGSSKPSTLPRRGDEIEAE